jgi:uncharacterized RDD family membrane protein YckC
MATLGITVLKNNAPWGPFSRAQIEDGLTRGDYTVKYLAHAPGLKEWLPLGEVLDYVDRHPSSLPALPPVPSERELPPIPEPFVKSPEPTASLPEPSRPPILPTSNPRPAPPILPVVEKQEIKPKPESRPETQLKSASSFIRGVAFVLDCLILFLPLVAVFILGALAIEIPAAIHHIPHQQRMDEWELLNTNLLRLLWVDAIGFGWLYSAGLECSQSQATIGKRWTGLKVTDLHGERLSFLRATGRYAVKFLSVFPCFFGFMQLSLVAILLGSLISAALLSTALISSRGRTLHDRLSGTRVIKN